MALKQIFETVLADRSTSFKTAALTLMISLPAASAMAAGNNFSLGQFGWGNGAAGGQFGNFNDATVVQEGFFNETFSSQDGNDNTVVVEQFVPGAHLTPLQLLSAARKQLGEGVVPLLTGITGNVVSTRTENAYGLHVDFTRDIFPILQSRCASCHSGATPAGKLDLNTAGIDTIGQTYYCLIRDKRQQCLDLADRYDTFQNDDPHIYGRPQVTRYVRAFNALGSLLYWKAAGQRTDNRLDTDHSDDIDFGVAHTTTITAEELGLLSRWIDIGAGGGLEELLDTQRPALNLAAVVSNDTITGFNVGTTDLGSGIDITTLKVCINDNSAGCTDISPNADPHGIVSITLQNALTDPDDTVFASISDIEGNITTTELTALHLGMMSGGEVPTVSPFSVTVDQDENIIIYSAPHMTVPSGETIVSASVVTDVTNGRLLEATGGTFVYIPDPGYSGSDSFSFTVTDSAGGVSSSGLVSITVSDYCLRCSEQICMP